MSSFAFAWRSLKTRVTLGTLAIFFVSIGLIGWYTMRMLRQDMQQLLSQQQFSTVSFVAAGIEQHLQHRLAVLDQAASLIGAVLPVEVGHWQRLHAEPLLQHGQFNDGIIVYGQDGTVLAEWPHATGRLGVNHADRDFLRGALGQGRPTIGAPFLGPRSGVALFVMATPIRNAQGRVIGAVAGVTDLGQPNFLDRFTDNPDGQTGGLLLVAPRQRLVLAASDKNRVMERLPALGHNPVLDRFIAGYEGSDVLVNTLGIEVLASAKRIAGADWYVAAALPTTEVFAPIDALQRRLWLASVLLALLAGSLTWWMLRGQLAPMLRAAEMLKHRSGSAQPLQPLPISRADEVGALVGSINRLLATVAQREQALRDSEAFKEVVMDSLPAELAVLDPNGVIQAVNQRWRQFALENSPTPERSAARTGVGTDYLAICNAASAAGDESATAAHNGILAVLNGQRPSFNLEYPCLAPTRQRWFMMVVMPLGSDARDGVVITHNDISALKEAEHYEQFRSHVLERMAVAAPLPELLDTLARGVEQMRPHWLCKIDPLDEHGQRLGLGAAPSLPDFFNTALDTRRLDPALAAAAETGAGVSVEDLARHPDWIGYSALAARAGLAACWSQPIRSGAGQLLGRFALFQRDLRTPTASDISLVGQCLRLAVLAIERHLAEQKIRASIALLQSLQEQMRELAFHDTLTELPNRRLLDDRLSQTMAASQRSGRFCALMFLDLDNFKPLNDDCGHAFGDLLLVEVARRLRHCVRQVDTVARIGGDEFVVMLHELDTDPAASHSQAQALAEKIRAALAEPYALRLHNAEAADPTVLHHCSVSIGLVLFVGQQSSQDELLQRADAAMYQAKQASRNQVWF